MDDKFINDFFVGMCDDICLEIIFDLHRAIRTNTLSATELFKIQPIDDKIQSRGCFITFSSLFLFHLLTFCLLLDNTKVLAVKDTIKPNTAANAQLTSLCPICSNIIGSKRFAPHLEKCMHGGRKRISVPADLPSSSSTNSVSSSSGHVKKKRATRTLIFRILVNNNGGMLKICQCDW